MRTMFQEVKVNTLERMTKQRNRSYKKKESKVNFRTGKYNNQNKNSLDGLNCRMNMREEKDL